jgi:crotonobetainyl-CoA:carnitine CoA-transferase CaiB-like acyl-CoA transferase
MLQEVEHPTAGRLKVTGIPVNFSETPGEIRLPPPLLGENSGEILRSYLGYSTEEVEELKKGGIV